jgi:hypothetical protein
LCFTAHKPFQPEAGVGTHHLYNIQFNGIQIRLERIDHPRKLAFLHPIFSGFAKMQHLLIVNDMLDEDG